METANEDTLIKKKIAPGTKGEFSILLNAKKNLNYKIIFEDLNEKPSNLKFIAMNNQNMIIETDTLEEMSNYLSGNISENEQIEFKIKWYWKFENIDDKNTTDFQDTNDGQKIKQYQFKVYTVAQESQEVEQIINRIVKIIFLGIVIISIGTIAKAKYKIDSEFCIANLAIDRQIPIIDVVEIQNSNSNYEGYANKNHTISITLKVIEKYIQDTYIDKKNIEIKVGGQEVKDANIDIKEISTNSDGKIYKIELNCLEGDGELELQILEGSVIDTSGLKNENKKIKTNIIIDNTPPSGKLTENKISGGKVNAVISMNENIRGLEGWNFSSDKLTLEKEFTNNISYELPIVDYAGNQIDFNIDITQATFVNIVYASHNSNIGWTYGYGNYDVAGSKAVKTDRKYKTEALAFRITGNVDNDFIQANAYVYTHWGEGSKARCGTSNMIYRYGHNPDVGTFKSMNSNDLVTISGNEFFQLGGAGVNTPNYTDINGNNPVPDTGKFSYGISGISMKLKDYSQFSIVYQILVNNVGWLQACSDGQECMYNKTKPMSAFRVALVPNTEKQYVLDTWNKDIGTYNL